MEKVNAVRKKMAKHIMSMVAYIVTIMTSTCMVFCDIFDDIQTAGLTFQDKFVTTVTVLFPLVAIVDIVFIIFTRDQRKLQAELTVLGGSVIGFVAMLIINGGTVVDTLKTIAGVI